ncbi:class I SAM-dependent methyltransferase [Reichenbachiella ulvae]|uniref:Class I SAM-dependent methyltransferase n=1 Tax=Reichenbachiella ulvae TaxID=2980104 RepID=A0ABT3CUG0_9BACT|nr:class I SAM-dependent methyltransferase [Reichenbachiella ulvae]MCV9386878.1 class I SAM-dependent methyltransferase [Reichenbachiella ulvae]
MSIQELNRLLGNIDIYLLDQILKGRIAENSRILDAGCGEGRNLIYFLNQGYDVHGVDMNPDAIRMLQFIVQSNFPTVEKERFQISPIDKMLYPDQAFDWVISSAVLHFSTTEFDFWKGIKEMTRVLKIGGGLFIRMTGEFGLDQATLEKQGEQYLLPDGSLRFLLTQQILDQMCEEYHFELMEPLKSVWVDGKRSMTTLVLRKTA